MASAWPPPHLAEHPKSGMLLLSDNPLAPGLLHREQVISPELESFKITTFHSLCASVVGAAVLKVYKTHSDCFP